MITMVYQDRYFSCASVMMDKMQSDNKPMVDMMVSANMMRLTPLRLILSSILINRLLIY